MAARAQHAKVGMDTVESSAGQAPQRPTDVGQTPDIEDLAAEVLKRGQHSAGYHALSDDDVRRVRASLLGWYDLHKREMPWRQATPTVDHMTERDRREIWSLRGYQVWVSEIMLQQRWPTVYDLATADPELGADARVHGQDVNKLWNGLGYYSRARRLHEGAKLVVQQYDGVLPTDPKEMQRKIPGIGPYTAGAIASIAFNQVAELVDGNVVRVLSRLRAISGDPQSTAVVAQLWALAHRLVDPGRPGDFNQALMDLGATVCTPTSPGCSACPVAASCRAAAEERAGRALAVDRLRRAVARSDAPPAQGATLASEPACTLCPSRSGPLTAEALQAGFPVTRFPCKPDKADKALRTETILVGVIYSVDAGDAAAAPSFFVRQRPAKGLLAGLWECPNVAITVSAPAAVEPAGDDGMASAIATARVELDALLVALGALTGPADVVARRTAGRFEHVFSHLKHDYIVEALQVRSPPPRPPSAAHGRWVREADLATEAITTGMRKAIKLASAGAGSKAAGPAASKRVPASASSGPSESGAKRSGASAGMPTPSSTARPAAKRAKPAGPTGPASKGPQQRTLGAFFAAADS